MFGKITSAAVGALLSCAPLYAASLEETCDRTGTNARFCAGTVFAQVAPDTPEGVTFWLHERGYLSKVLVEDTGTATPSAAEVEARIVSIVAQQAAMLDRTFDFADLEAGVTSGVSFGTLRYALRTGDRGQTILHSYVAAQGVVVQVISQVALKSASRDLSDLTAAHADALRAVRLDPSDPGAATL